MKLPKKMRDVDSYNEFIKNGGGKSGVYDISDPKTKDFVKKYKKFIHKKEVYKRNKNWQLVPKYYKYRKQHKRWLKTFKKNNRP